MAWKVILASLAAAGMSGAAHAGFVGPAADYNVVILGNGSFSGQHTDVEGAMAVGGNVSLQNYAVASSIPGSPSSPNPARLVVGGTLTATNGGVGQGQNGAIYLSGATPPTLTGFTATGGTFFGQTLVDFSAAQTVYQGMTVSLGGLAATGTSNVQFGALNLTGALSGLNVFSVNAADLTSTNTVNVSVPNGATVLINVVGSSTVFQNGQVMLSGTTPSRVLYNFPTATAINLSGSKDPQGSILAPYAVVTGGFGQMSGQLIAAGYGGNGGDPYGHTEFNNVSFAGEIPVSQVPIPAAALLFGTGMALFAGIARSRGARPC